MIACNHLANRIRLAKSKGGRMMDATMREKIFKNLGRAGNKGNWETFLKLLSTVDNESAICGILQTAAYSICSLDFSSITLADRADVFREGLGLYLDIAELKRPDSLPENDSENKKLPFNEFVVSKACSMLVGIFLNDLFYDRLIAFITQTDAKRLLRFLATPHHYIDKQPYRRRAQVFLLKLWERTLQNKQADWEVTLFRVLRVRDNFEYLVEAMFN